MKSDKSDIERRAHAVLDADEANLAEVDKRYQRMQKLMYLRYGEAAIIIFALVLLVWGGWLWM